MEKYGFSSSPNRALDEELAKIAQPLKKLKEIAEIGIQNLNAVLLDTQDQFVINTSFAGLTFEEARTKMKELEETNDDKKKKVEELKKYIDYQKTQLATSLVDVNQALSALVVTIRNITSAPSFDPVEDIRPPAPSPAPEEVKVVAAGKSKPSRTPRGGSAISFKTPPKERLDFSKEQALTCYVYKWILAQAYPTPFLICDQTETLFDVYCNKTVSIVQEAERKRHVAEVIDAFNLDPMSMIVDTGLFKTPSLYKVINQLDQELINRIHIPGLNDPKFIEISEMDVVSDPVRGYLLHHTLQSTHIERLLLGAGVIFPHRSMAEKKAPFHSSYRLITPEAMRDIQTMRTSISRGDCARKIEEDFKNLDRLFISKRG